MRAVRATGSSSATRASYQALSPGSSETIAATSPEPLQPNSQTFTPGGLTSLVSPLASFDTEEPAPGLARAAHQGIGHQLGGRDPRRGQGARAVGSRIRGEHQHCGPVGRPGDVLDGAGDIADRPRLADEVQQVEPEQARPAAIRCEGQAATVGREVRQRIIARARA